MSDDSSDDSERHLLTRDDVLAFTADAVLRMVPDDPDSDVPCSYYLMIASCEVLKTIVESCPPAAREAGQKIVLPGPSSFSVAAGRRAVALLHGCRTLDSIRTLENIEDAWDVLRCLGCTSFDQRMRHRIWDILADTTRIEILAPRATSLLEDPDLCLVCITKLCQLCPLWTSFERDVLPHLDLTVDLARWLLHRLATPYPPAAVLQALLQRINGMRRIEGASVFAAVAALVRGLGELLHPVEACAILSGALNRASIAEAGEAGAVMREALNAISSPAAHAPPAVVHGTLLCYVDRLAASALLQVDVDRGSAVAARRRAGRVPRAARVKNLAPWLPYLCIDFAGGGVSGAIVQHKAADPGSGWRPYFQVRITAALREDAKVLGETMYVFGPSSEGIAPRRQLSEAARTLESTAPLSLSGALQLSDFHERGALRVDIFFAEQSITVSPLAGALSSGLHVILHAS